MEYRLLEYLALNLGQPVSKTQLTEHLYAQDFDRDSNTLEVIVGAAAAQARGRPDRNRPRSRLSARPAMMPRSLTARLALLTGAWVACGLVAAWFLVAGEASSYIERSFDARLRGLLDAVVAGIELDGPGQPVLDEGRLGAALRSAAVGRLLADRRPGRACRHVAVAMGPDAAADPHRPSRGTDEEPARSERAAPQGRRARHRPARRRRPVAGARRHAHDETYGRSSGCGAAWRWDLPCSAPGWWRAPCWKYRWCWRR